MNFNIDLSKTVGDMLNNFESSDRVFVLVWALVFILFLFVLGKFIQAIRWW